jgi:hypothetical protein
MNCKSVSNQLRAVQIEEQTMTKERREAMGDSSRSVMGHARLRRHPSISQGCRTSAAVALTSLLCIGSAYADDPCYEPAQHVQQIVKRISALEPVKAGGMFRVGVTSMGKYVANGWEVKYTEPGGRSVRFEISWDRDKGDADGLGVVETPKYREIQVEWTYGNAIGCRYGVVADKGAFHSHRIDQ